MPDGRCAVLDEMLLAAEGMSFEQCDELAEQLIAARRIYVHGAGRCGLIMRTFAIRLTHLSLPVHVVGDAASPAAGFKRCSTNHKLQFIPGRDSGNSLSDTRRCQE